MGNSTIKLTDVYNTLAAQGVPDPRGGPSGYGDKNAIEMACEVMADIITERYNWKWNRAVAAPFYTNSNQQDYPQPALAAGPIGWGESLTLVDINNTVVPKPMWSTPQVTWRKDLPPTNATAFRPSGVCWMYNGNMQLGVWPGAGVTYYPLVTTQQNQQNPIMSMLDVNGNILIVTVFGTTGLIAPVLPAASAEGTTIIDGSVTWMVVSPTSQGFRVNALPGATQPTYQITPVYQLEPPRFVNMQQTLNPIPDSFSRHFYRGLYALCLQASVNPGDFKRGQDAMQEWRMALMAAKEQGNKEADVYGLIPATSVVERRWGDRGPYTADNPY